jgi:hypothetical protein
MPPPKATAASGSGFKGRLAGRYLPAVALVVCALVTYLLATSALFPLEQAVARGTG